MEGRGRLGVNPFQHGLRSGIGRWVRVNSMSIVCYGAFAIAYLTLSWAGAPHLIDNYPDSHTYLHVSFFGHAERLWTIPVVYFVGGTTAIRVTLQTLIGVACWITLSVQLRRVVHNRVIRFVSQTLVLSISLTAPILQWNRIVLSESIAISLTVLLLAASLALARRMDSRSMAAFLIAAVLWTFTRQVHAFITVALAAPFAFVAWHRPEARRLAVVGLAGVAFIGIWGTATALQTSSASPAGIATTNPTEVQVAGIIQFRAITDPREMTFLWNHGLPHTSALRSPPPFTTLGQPVNVTQFADPYAEYRLADDPAFKRWADRNGEAVFLKYLITHPWSTISQPLIHAPQLMTMNPDYIASPALPPWASTLVYGNLKSISTPNAPWGPPRSSDPIYLEVIVAFGAFLFFLAALRRRLTRAMWVAAAALVVVAVWALAIWNFAATELPREFIAPAVLVHLAVIVLIASSLDSLVGGGNQRKEARAKIADQPDQVTLS